MMFEEKNEVNFLSFISEKGSGQNFKNYHNS